MLLFFLHEDIFGAGMTRTALTFSFILVLCSAVLSTQIVSLAEANPDWNPSKVSTPTIEILLPVEGHNYSSSDVLLNFTVIRPADWLYFASLGNNSDVYLSQGQIEFVTYSVDGIVMDGMADEHESERIEVNDHSNTVNPPSNFSFSFNLKGLEDGQHTIKVYTEGYVNGTGVSVISQTIHFAVYTPEPQPFATPLVIAPIATVTVVGVGLFVYFKKRKS